MMVSESETLTREEFASLLIVGNTCAVREPPAVIPTKHSTRLIALSRIAQLDHGLPPGPMSALGGSGRAASKEEVRV